MNEDPTAETKVEEPLTSKSLMEDLNTFWMEAYKIEDQKVYVIGAMISKLGAMYEAMSTFCDRVEAGEVKSIRTYARFCEILERENKLEEQFIMDLQPKNNNLL